MSMYLLSRKTIWRVSLVLWVYALVSSSQAQTCNGNVWPCQSGCHRAEFITLTADCTTPREGICCLFIYAVHACRKQPNCVGERCGNTREVKLKIVSAGNCSATSGQTRGFRCGDHFVLDGGGNSIGASFLIPPTCGEPVLVLTPAPPTPTPTPTPTPREVIIS